MKKPTEDDVLEEQMWDRAQQEVGEHAAHDATVNEDDRDPEDLGKKTAFTNVDDL